MSTGPRKAKVLLNKWGEPRGKAHTLDCSHMQTFDEDPEKDYKEVDADQIPPDGWCRFCKGGQ